MTRNLAPAFIAGVASAALYFIVSVFGLGFLFLFLPTLPIFWLGLSKHSELSLYACIIGLAIISLGGNPALAFLVYGMGIAFPAWYIAREALRHGGKDGLIIWYPLSAIFARLMAACVFALLAATLFFSRNPGGLPAIMAQMIDTMLTTLTPELDARTNHSLATLAPYLSFIILSGSAWVWSLCLYLHAWLVNRELKRQDRNIRPDMAVIALPPPNWMISLMLITALASLVGSPHILAFWGKTGLVMLMLPYFLFGLALIHRHAKQLEYRYVFLFMLYVLIFAMLWVALAVAAYGIITHLRLLNKYLSSTGRSSKN